MKRGRGRPKKPNAKIVKKVCYYKLIISFFIHFYLKTLKDLNDSCLTYRKRKF